MPFEYVSLTMLQNEADIVEYFIRANLRFLDHMVIIVNPSSDDTQEILDRLTGERLPITVWRTQINHYSQGEMLSWFASNLREQLRPSYLFLIDADEVLLASSKDSFQAALQNIPEGQVGSIGWRTFLPKQSASSSAFKVSNYGSRLSEEIMPVQKLVVASRTDIHESQPFQHGTHRVYGRNGEMVREHPISEIEIAHLPVRSIAQVREKAAASTLSRVLAHGTDWHGNQSVQYDLVWRILKRTPVPSVREIATQYLKMDPEAPIPATVTDGRLPDIPTPLSSSKSAKDKDALYLQLVDRLFHSVFPLADPTRIIKKTLDQNLKAASNDQEELPAGAFPTLQHARSLKCDWPPIEDALVRFAPDQVLDLGCGLGAYLRLSEETSVDVLGVDGAPWSNLHFISRDKYIQHDLSKGPPSIDKTFHLSLCLEVVEHLPERAGLEIVEWLAKNSTKGIVFSAARPAQPGHCHITCREPAFWLEAFSDLGWSVDPASTASLRLTSTLHWFKCNIFVLRPEKQQDEGGLAHIHSLPYPVSLWPNQGEGQKIIGFAGKYDSFTLDGQKRIAPLPDYSDQKVRFKTLESSVSELNDKISELKEKVLRSDDSNVQLAHTISKLAETINDVLSSKWWRLTCAPRRWSNSVRKLRGRPKKAWPSAVEFPAGSPPSRALTDHSSQPKSNHFDACYEEFRPFTMTGKERFVANLSLISALRPEMSEKSVVETGVWRGGMSFGMMRQVPECKEFHLFDSFEGLPNPSERDGSKANRISELNLFVAERNYADFLEVAEAVEKFGFRDRAKLHKGWFDQTVQASLIERPIGILRLDGDWYESTMVVLERLFDRVVPGGLIILDDYFDWPGCSQAVHDFLSGRNRTEVIRTYENIVAYILKTSDTALDEPVSDSELDRRRALNRAPV